MLGFGNLLLKLLILDLDLFLKSSEGQVRLHPGQQLFCLKRLRHIIHPSNPETLDLVYHFLRPLMKITGICLVF